MLNKQLENTLISLKEIVFDPNKQLSPQSKKEADTLVNAAFENIRGLQGFTLKDFLNMIQISVIGVAYSEKGIKDPFLLMALTNVVPEDLSPKSVYRKDDNGKPRLWYFSDLKEEVKSKPPEDNYGKYYLFRSYGEYALFVSGIFSDMLFNKRKLTVDIPYYECTGASAFHSASNSKVVADSVAASSLEELAIHFKTYRYMLTKASAKIGAPARRRFLEDTFEKLGLVKIQSHAYYKEKAEAALQRKKEIADLEVFKFEHNNYNN
jgi:hypothetical protein